MLFYPIKRSRYKTSVSVVGLFLGPPGRSAVGKVRDGSDEATKRNGSVKWKDERHTGNIGEQTNN